MNTNTDPANKAAEVFTPKFDLSPQAEKTLLGQVVDFLLPANASRLAKLAYVLLNGVGGKSAADQEAFVASYKLEYVTGIVQTDEQNCVRAIVAASLLTVSRRQTPMTASDKVEEAKELLSDMTAADW